MKFILIHLSSWHHLCNAFFKEVKIILVLLFLYRGFLQSSTIISTPHSGPHFNANELFFPFACLRILWQFFFWKGRCVNKNIWSILTPKCIMYNILSMEHGTYNDITKQKFALKTHTPANLSTARVFIQLYKREARKVWQWGWNKD